MRQAHPAGERLFVDYGNQTVDLIDPARPQAVADLALARGDAATHG
jgi:hypothetical protein